MFEKLGRRTQQLAASVLDRVDNLIKEHSELLKKNKELRLDNRNLVRDYHALISCPEIKSILDKAVEEKNEFITNLMSAYDKASNQ